MDDYSLVDVLGLQIGKLFHVGLANREFEGDSN